MVYVGDTNVTVGKPFWIQCLAEGPIEWHKDNQPIQQMHFIRHSKEDYSYSQQDDPFADGRKVKSTIRVKHALKMHSGKYKCNMKHENSHVLHIHDAKSVIVELDSENGSMEDDYDENDIGRVSFEPPIIAEDALKSTMMMYVEEVSESNRLFSANFDESYEQLLEKNFNDFERLEFTTQSLPVISTSTTTHPPKHEINHKHNKHTHGTQHPPHETLKHLNHVLLTQESQLTAMHETDPTIPLTTEHTTTVVPKHHHKGSHDDVKKIFPDFLLPISHFYSFFTFFRLLNSFDSFTKLFYFFKTYLF